MYCEQCGQENKDQAQFCGKCGAPLSQGQQLNIKNHKKQIITGVIFLTVMFVFIIGFFVYSIQKQADYKDKLQTADKYLQVHDYKNAETTYLKAIEIKPKKEEAYLELSDVYAIQGKYDKAISTLKTGEKKVGGNKFEVKINEAQKAKKNSSIEAQYQAYYQLCANYQEKYGEGKCDNSLKNDDALLANTEVLGGLCVVQLIDFNKDGNEELLLGYGKLSDDGISTLMQYYYEIWAWKDEKIAQIQKKTEANHGQDVTCWIETADSHQGLFLVQDYAGDEVHYLQYTGKKFRAKYKIEGWENQAYSTQQINGKKATLSEIKDLESKLARPLDKAYSKVTFKESYINEDNKTLFVPLNYIATATAKAVLEATYKTLELLKNSHTESTLLQNK